MKKVWEQLKPQERRLVIIISVLVFVVLNYWIVFPRFREWSVNDKRIKDARKRIADYSVEINRASTYQKLITEFDPESKGVPLEDQAYNFETFFRERAMENGVQIQSVTPRTPRTNDFFIERQTSIDVISGESNLVGYLYSLGSSASQMRVRSMTLHAVEPTRYRLRATLTIVANYARKTPVNAPRASASAVPELNKTGAGKPSATNAANRLIPPPTKPGATNKPGATQTNKPGTPKR